MDEVYRAHRRIARNSLPEIMGKRRFMRPNYVLAILCICSPAFAQAPPSDTQTLPALLAEVHQLRLAIERSTLLGTRTQISIQLLQTQQARTEKLSSSLDELRKQIGRFDQERGAMAMQLKDAEAQVADSRTPPETRVQMERMVNAIRSQRNEPSPQEIQMRAKEAEPQNQLWTEQNRLSQLQNQISEMDRALDEAIRQITAR
jgi:hypothetical protein